MIYAVFLGLAVIAAFALWVINHALNQYLDEVEAEERFYE